jgi:D-sedoheptulose 7-phosphate isomerase
VQEHLDTIAKLHDQAAVDAITTAADTVTRALAARGKLILFGNGGSAADAQHIAAEFAGRFLVEREPLPALALTTNASAISAIANDYGFDDVFARQVEGLAATGDVVIGISTSGESVNVVRGLAAARRAGAATIALVGAAGGAVAAEADHVLHAPSTETPRIQEAHVLIGHLLCEIAEGELAPRAAGG